MANDPIVSISRIAMKLLALLLCLSTASAFAPVHRPVAFQRAVQLYSTPPPTLESTTTFDLKTTAVEECVKPEEELSESQKLLKKVKEAGTAGIISYALWELAFWFISIPVVAFGYYEVMGHWPDFSNNDDMAKLGAEAFAFVNFARFAVPLRIGLALSTTPWIQDNVVDRFMNKNKDEGDECQVPE